MLSLGGVVGRSEVGGVREADDPLIPCGLPSGAAGFHLPGCFDSQDPASFMKCR